MAFRFQQEVLEHSGEGGAMEGEANALGRYGTSIGGSLYTVPLPHMVAYFAFLPSNQQSDSWAK